MPCYFPLTGYRKLVTGQLTFNRRESAGVVIQVACGQCVGCRIMRSREWAVRCVHEAQMHDTNSFVTLTYAPEHLPRGGSLVKADHQQFMKRLRKRTGRFIRYYMCGEYGSSLGRPHYHFLLFGLGFPDRYFWRDREGSRTYRSEFLESIWTKGHAEIGEVTFRSAAYVARYIMKKQTGQAAQKYETVDGGTGEIFEVLPEYNAMSLKPGIGRTWFEKYYSDVFPGDFVVLEGKKFKTPEYYRSLLKEVDPELAEKLRKDRIKRAKAKASDNTPERLAVKEYCQQERLRRLPRNLGDQHDSSDVHDLRSES